MTTVGSKDFRPQCGAEAGSQQDFPTALLTAGSDQLCVRCSSSVWRDVPRRYDVGKCVRGFA